MLLKILKTSETKLPTYQNLLQNNSPRAKGFDKRQVSLRSMAYSKALHKVKHEAAPYGGALHT
jgi:hypothetical protein